MLCRIFQPAGRTGHCQFSGYANRAGRATDSHDVHIITKWSLCPVRTNGGLTIMNVLIAGPPAVMYGVTSRDLKSASVPVMAALNVMCPTISGGGEVLLHCGGDSGGQRCRLTQISMCSVAWVWFEAAGSTSIARPLPELTASQRSIIFRRSRRELLPVRP